MLFSVLTVPVAKANTGAATQQSTAQAASVSGTDDQKAAKTTTKAAIKPRDKSVLDDDVLESPLAYLRNAFTPEEEGSDTSVNPGALMITVKALIATLLSTIM
ncbi:MAG: hypothetical protein LPK14_13880 [Hymenobacteraceae bacterium]|nr:hypothetical protein [Hymenobacteraceae bacterium]